MVIRTVLDHEVSQARGLTSELNSTQNYII